MTEFKPFRSLKNYKAIHMAAAKAKGVEKALAEAPTLTAARKIVFGTKHKGPK